MRVPPLIMGHEFAGEVAILGKGVSNAKVGDKVGVITNLFCGVCPACKAGLTNICDNRLIIGTTMKAGSYNGAMADYVLAPAAKLFPLSGKYSFSEYSLLEPLSTALRATKLAGDLKGKNHCGYWLRSHWFVGYHVHQTVLVPKRSLQSIH